MTADFQASSSRQGKEFEQRCNLLLSDLGWPLAGRLKLVNIGVEIDQTTMRNGRVVWIEYKGSEGGKRPGLRRTDSMKKAIANGALTKQIRGNNVLFWVVTSHMPLRGSSLMMAKEAIRLGYVDRFVEGVNLAFL